jgi:Tol biopolymer transport system component
MLEMVGRSSAFGVLRNLVVVSAALTAASHAADGVIAQEIKKEILLVTSLGTPDVLGPNIVPEICALQVDASGRKPLFSEQTLGFDPVLSPDGTRIAFVGSNGEEPRTEKYAWALYVMNADGSARKRLTETANSAERLLAPSWSADGKKIAFCTLGWGMGRTGPVMSSAPRVCIIDADGRNLKRLDKLHGVNPVWSPDGKQLLFTRLGKDFEASLCVADADGGGVRPLLPRNDYPMITGAWSPDGKWLAYAALAADPDRRANGKRNAAKLFLAQASAGLFLTQADGSQPKRLAGGPDQLVFGVQWSADSKRLFFTRRDRSGPLFNENNPAESRRWGPGAVYAIDVNGKHLRRLTTGKEREYVGGNLLFGMGFLTP